MNIVLKSNFGSASFVKINVLFELCVAFARALYILFIRMAIDYCLTSNIFFCEKNTILN